MWEYVLVLCMVVNFDGIPMNKCYSKKSPQKYQTQALCKAAAAADDFEVYMSTRGTGQGLPVIKTACGKFSKGA